MDQYFDAPVEVKNIENEWQETPELILKAAKVTYGFQEYIFELDDRDLDDDVWSFFFQIHQQGLMGRANNIFLQYFLDEPNRFVSLINTGNNKVLPLVEKLQELDENPANFNGNDLIQLYSEASLILEDVQPPLVAVINGLDDDSMDTREVRSRNLANLVSQFIDTPHLCNLIDRYEVNLRNAISHGGDSGYHIDQINDEIIFRYKDGDDIKQVENSLIEFRQQTKSVVVESVALFIVLGQIPIMEMLFVFREDE